MTAAHGRLLLMLLMLGGVHALIPVSAPTLTPRSPARVVRHPRLPVWPAWQGLVLGVAGQVPGLRGVTDFLEDKFGGRVCPMSLDASDCDPFILLVHHRHAFRPLDFLRPLFSAIIMPEGFPAHPHRSRVNMCGPAAGRNATRRSRSQPACSGPVLWDQEKRPRPLGCRREAAVVLWCLPKAADVTATRSVIIDRLINVAMFCHVIIDHLVDVAAFGHAGTGASKP